MTRQWRMVVLREGEESGWPIIIPKLTTLRKCLGYGTEKRNRDRTFLKMKLLRILPILYLRNVGFGIPALLVIL